MSYNVNVYRVSKNLDLNLYHSKSFHGVRTTYLISLMYTMHRVMEICTA